VVAGYREAAPRRFGARRAAHGKRLHEIGRQGRRAPSGSLGVLAKEREQRLGQAGVERHEIE
jgi:hypothetical protein